MRYLSTRSGHPEADFTDALLNGLAPDGGLYMPETWPALSAEALGGEYAVTAREVMTAFAGDALPAEAVERAVARLVAGFDAIEVTPLVRLSDRLSLLELHHGPTAAFKDLAMQLAASLTEAALTRSGEQLTLFVATSGDTGAAAVRAFEGMSRVRLVVLHPLNRVSPVQRRQMTTCQADNVLNLAVEGDFDDCQRLVKQLLAHAPLREGGRVSSVNSINWARLAGQIPYYAVAAHTLRSRGVAGAATYVVPTGNFGDAFAGWAAGRMGAPVGGLVAAVNRNDALARALETGVYARAPAQPTMSVSMDVQAPSNFERLVFEATGRDPDRTRAVFETFAREGEVQLDDDLLARLRAEVGAVSVGEAETAQEMRRTLAETGLIVCPHTAVALAAARRLDTPGPIVALATAHPAKFAEAVRESTHRDPPPAWVLEGLSGRPERVTRVRPDLDAVLALL
jgi:threonine synthase